MQASCYTGIPLKSGKSENNRTYEVSYLFEHDGIKVYRFFDMGKDVYKRQHLLLPCRLRAKAAEECFGIQVIALFH